MRLNQKSYIQVRMHTRGVYVLNEGAWPNAHLYNHSHYCMLPSSKSYLLSEGHENQTWTQRFQLTFRIDVGTLNQHTYVCVSVPCKVKDRYALICEMRLTANIQANKAVCTYKRYAPNNAKIQHLTDSVCKLTYFLAVFALSSQHFPISLSRLQKVRHTNQQTHTCIQYTNFDDNPKITLLKLRIGS